MSSKLRVERQISLIAREEAEDGCQWQLATVPLSPLRQDVALRPQLGVLEIALGKSAQGIVHAVKLGHGAQCILWLYADVRSSWPTLALGFGRT